MSDSILLSSDDGGLVPLRFGTRSKNTVEEDKRDVEKLINSAKYGNWEGVYSVLGKPGNPKKSFLINCIPENRRWGVIQQAVYWKNEKEIATLKKFSTFDPNVRAKPGTSEIGQDGGLTACDIAQKFGSTKIARLLQETVNSIDGQTLNTFENYISGIENELLGLVRITLGAYKNTFHPGKVDPSKPLMAVLKDVFNGMNSSATRWKEIRDKICESLGIFCEDTHSMLVQCSTRDEFYAAIISTYTIENNVMYDILNTALRRQRRHNYRPTAVDLAIGPYVVVYQMLLMYWDKLAGEKGTTFRKMKVSKTDANKYSVGTKFIWLSFVSSSVLLEKAIPFPTVAPSGNQTIIFKINNRANSPWQPRNIEEFAVFMENERVYPPGSRFIVTERRETRNGDISIGLNLLSE